MSSEFSPNFSLSNCCKLHQNKWVCNGNYRRTCFVYGNSKQQIKPIQSKLIMSVARISPICFECLAFNQRFAFDEKLNVTGKCNQTHIQGNCNGEISYPIKNPSNGLHNKMIELMKVGNRS